MVLHDAKDQFYTELYHKIESNEITSKVFADFITSTRGEHPEDSTSGFYELCSKFSDISLNAPKWADSKTCDVQASFQFKDIDAAKAAFKSYVSQKGLTDYEGVLDAIGLMHRLAVAWDDPRAKSGLVQPKDYKWNSPFFGKYHNFCEIPDDFWQTLKEEILKEIS